MSVAFHNVSKRFSDGTLALDNLEFKFSKGEFIIFLGPSGSGKTTACRCLAGLEEITSGQVLVDDKDITDLPPRERNMSMVFQNYALYSHKIVYENIAYPLRIRKYSREKIDQMVNDVAKLLQIDDYLGRKPRHLVTIDHLLQERLQRDGLRRCDHPSSRKQQEPAGQESQVETTIAVANAKNKKRC